VPNETWRIYVVTRVCLPKGGYTGQGHVLAGSVSDNSDNRIIAKFEIGYNRFTDGRYQTIDLGVHRLTPGMFVWFPSASAAFEQVCFDRILLVREPSNDNTRTPAGRNGQN